MKVKMKKGLEIKARGMLLLLATMTILTLAFVKFDLQKPEGNMLFDEPGVLNKFKFDDEGVNLFFSDCTIKLWYIETGGMWEKGQYKPREEIRVKIYPDVDQDEKEWIIGKEGYCEIHIKGSKLDDPLYIDPVLRERMISRGVLILGEKKDPGITEEVKQWKRY
jgi:hypothetical protein